MRYRVRPRTLKPLALGLVLCGGLSLSPLALSGAVYKWVDEVGQVHYTQERPPAGVNAETVKPPPRAADPELAEKQLEEREKLLEGYREGRAEQAEIDNKIAEQDAWKKENCKRAKQSVQAYSIPNALVEQADGSRARFTEDERLAGLKEAGDRVKEYCD
jgi:hypothetical protein